MGFGLFRGVLLSNKASWRRQAVPACFIDRATSFGQRLYSRCSFIEHWFAYPLR